MAGVDADRLVHNFLNLVSIYSPSYQEAEVAALLEQELRSLGLEVRNDGTGPGNTGNVIGLLAGDGRGTPIFLGAHMDTVEPGRGIKPVFEAGVIRSDGTTILSADCKATTAAILEALRVVQGEGLPHGDVETVFTYGEEQGMIGARMLDISGLRARLGFIADNSGAPGGIIVEAPAQNRIRAVFHGKAVHAGGEPEKGINALKAAATAIHRMPLGRIDEETTANIGIITGGISVNIVPDRVEIKGEARSRNNEKLERQTAAMVEAMKVAAEEVGARLESDVEPVYQAYRLAADSPVVRMAWDAAEAVGLQPLLRVTGGGTDANILNARGMPTVVITNGMVKPHSLEERIAVADMVALTNQLIALIGRAAQAG